MVRQEKKESYQCSIKAREGREWKIKKETKNKCNK